MTKIKIMKYISITLLLIMLVCSLMTSTAIFADEVVKEYSNVLSDLEKDDTFDVANYPSKDCKYELNVIQISESSDNELFIYVYQPSEQGKELKATSINISTSINNELSYKNYKLRWLSTHNTLSKYLVEDLTVITSSTRYYNISSIYRAYDKTIDNELSNGNTVTEVPYAVNKQYCFSLLNGKEYCSVLEVDTITVTDKFVGFVRYSNGFTLYPSSCDSHFVAFNTDRKIEKLMEADVYYTSQSYTRVFGAGIGANEEFGTPQDEYAYPTSLDLVEHKGGGWFAGTYRWNRIEKVSDFIKNENVKQDVYTGAILNASVANVLTDETLKNLQGKEWVLRFVETDYSRMGAMGSTTTSSTLVGDVSILRLKFETDGMTYNLGVIDNKQSGSKDPVNSEEIIVGIKDSLKKGLGWLLVAIILIFLLPVLPYIVNAVIWLIALPFKAIKAIFNAFKKE